jgi:hypothetical protein
VGKNLSETDADVKLLLREIMPVTQEGLEKQNAFLPMGALVASDGTVRRLDFAVDAAAPVKTTMDQLRAMLRQEVATGTVRSAAVVADVKIWRRSDGDEASNAVSVHVEHQSGYCVDLLIPYKVRKGMMSRITSKPQVMFRKMVAQEAEPLFWADAMPVI